MSNISWPLCRPCSELICPRDRKSSWLPWKALHKNGSEKSTFNEDNSDRTVHNLYPIKSQRRGSPSRNLVSRMSLLFPPLRRTRARERGFPLSRAPLWALISSLYKWYILYVLIGLRDYKFSFGSVTLSRNASLDDLMNQYGRGNHPSSSCKRGFRVMLKFSQRVTFIFRRQITHHTGS